MYAFTDELRHAWQTLFNEFMASLDDRDQLENELVFDTAEQVLRDPALFIGHTCGYPLMSRLRDALTPFCVPVFDIEGTDGKLYSSRIIVAADSNIENLDECAGRIVAVNHNDSNSGMNVLRHAVAGLNPATPFFASVLDSGGHLQSLTAVAEKRADVAAIDCVSFRLIADKWPELISRIRVIADSVKTSGLPFVMPNTRLTTLDSGQITAALNTALDWVDPQVKERLHLSHFASVDFDDYQSILDVESYAINSDYPRLI